MHMATLALHNNLPRGNCTSCDRKLVRRGVLDCRLNAELNGRDAAMEMARHLLPRARSAVGL